MVSHRVMNNWLGGTLFGNMPPLLIAVVHDIDFSVRIA